MANGAYAFLSGEFLVNTTTTGVQTDPQMTALAGGGFVITWTDNSGLGGDSSGASVKAQLYDANGNRVGSEFLVNTATANAQNFQTITALTGGGFVVSWTDNSATGPDPDHAGIKAQIFNASGAKVGGEFLVNTTTQLSQTNSAVTGLANGGFVVTWMDASATQPDNKGTGVRAQMYNASGQKVGGEFLVNTTIVSSQQFPVITGLANGGFVASWVDSSGLGGDPTAPSIKAQVFGANGAKLGTEFLVNTSTASSQDQVTITALSTGGFVIVWRDLSGVGDTSSSGLKAQLYDPSGSRIGTEFQVNTTELNSQDQPTVTAIPGGGFAVSWRDNSNLSADSSGFGIKTQIFDTSGNKLGSEFQINGITTGNQEMPSIIALASGALVVSWTDSSGIGGDTDGAIKARILTPTVGAISDIGLSNTTLSETEVENTIVGSLTGNGAANAGYTYQIIDDSTGDAFAIAGDKLVVKDSLALDYETQPNVTLTVRATDSFGNTFDKVFSLSLTDATIENRYGAGTEQLANTAISGTQQTPAITALTNGNYVITWADGSAQGTDTSSYGIKAQVVDENGTKIGGEFLVNTATLNSQDTPSIAGTRDGGFVVVWVDLSLQGGDSSSSGIKGQQYDAGGNKVGGEFLVNTTTTNAQKTPSVAALSSGGYVVTWADSSLLGGDNSVSGIKAQIYDATGTKVGGEFLVNTNTANGQDVPMVTGLAGGGFVATWHDSSLIGGDTSKDAVKAQVFTASGTKVGGEFLVNTQTKGNQQQESIAALDNGGFVITWADASNLGGDPDNYGIKMQIYDAGGNKVGGETLVNTTMAGAQIAPAVTALSTGGFVVSWADYSGAGAENGTAGIKAQIYTDDGSAIGGEFTVNSEILGAQVDPTIAANGDGSFMVGWTDYSGQGGDDSASGIKLRGFHPLGSQGAPPSLVATADTLAATEDTLAVYQASTLLANDIDSAGLPLTLTSVSSVSGGTVSLDNQGQITFTPTANFNGAALFTYVVTDSAGATATGRVTINVAGVNDAPTANNDQIAISQNATSILASALLANDTDPDIGDILSIQSVSANSANGVQLSVSNGTIVYASGTKYQSLAAGQTATDSFSYTLTDAGGLTSTANVVLTITGVNDAPFSPTLAGSNVDENAANGTVVGTFAATDADSGDVLTYSLTNNAGGRFAIDANTGVITVANGSLLDYETAQTQGIVARATDSSGAFVENAYTIAINNLPEPKSWTGDNGVNVFTASTNDLWTINGLGGNDVLTGNASADTINGGAGNDTINGAGGADTMLGGTGDDTYFVDNLGDKVIENVGEGADLVNASINYTLGDNVENLTLTGSLDLTGTGNAVGNTINGNSGNNVIYGLGGSDLINANDGNDTIYGGDGGDYLFGNNGNDIIYGGAGADEETGGAGNDIFVFDSLTTSADRDKIKDFTPGEDLFQISQAAFTAFAGTVAGAMPASAFVNGTQATTASQHIIYQQSTGNLYYDPDGVGGQAQVQIALLSTKPALTSASFTIGA